jgi:hypothetical protein
MINTFHKHVNVVGGIEMESTRGARAVAILLMRRCPCVAHPKRCTCAYIQCREYHRNNRLKWCKRCHTFDVCVRGEELQLWDCLIHLVERRTEISLTR